MEEKHGRPLQVLPFAQVQVLDDALDRFAKHFLRKPSAPHGPATERIDNAVVKVLQPYAGKRYVIPSPSVPCNQESSQCGTPEHLLRAAAAVVVLPLVAGRMRMRPDHDF